MENERLGERQLDQRKSQARAAGSGAGPAEFERQTLGAEGPLSSSGLPAAPALKRSGLLAAVVAAGVVAAMGTAWFMSVPEAKGDAGLTNTQQAARLSAFQNRGPVAFPVVPTAERQQALASMSLPADQQATLARDLERPDNALVYVTVWDDYAQDGDVITINSSGFSRTVSLTNAPQRFAVPITAGKVTLSGIQDGGGGITLGAQADGGTVLVPVLEPGQSVDVPVRLP